MSLLKEFVLGLIIIFFGYNLHIVWESTISELRGFRDTDPATISVILFHYGIHLTGFFAAWKQINWVLFIVEIVFIGKTVRNYFRRAERSYDDEFTTIKTVILIAIYLTISFYSK